VREIEDVTQRAAMSFFMRLISGRPVTSPRGLARTIADREVKNFYRAPARRENPDADPGVDQSQTTEDPAEVVAICDQLVSVATRLGPRYGLILCDAVLELASAQTAQKLGTTPGTVDVDRRRMRIVARKEVDL
jgi:DNA-directed RNA polymerase specialized sigma24 family protein